MCDVMDRAEKIGGDKREAQVREEMAAEMLKEGDNVDKMRRFRRHERPCVERGHWIRGG